jgi:hypothetical protein
MKLKKPRQLDAILAKLDGAEPPACRLTRTVFNAVDDTDAKGPSIKERSRLTARTECSL